MGKLQFFNTRVAGVNLGTPKEGHSDNQCHITKCVAVASKPFVIQ